MDYDEIVAMTVAVIAEELQMDIKKVRVVSFMEVHDVDSLDQKEGFIHE